MQAMKKSFRQLKSIWDEKLKASGFVDHEDKYGRLRNYTSIVDQDDEKEFYYRMAGQFLHDHEFLKPIHRKVWDMHCSGKGRNAIYAVLALAHKHVTPAKVRRILEKLRREFATYRYLREA